jgi:hypothetical protein
MSECVEDLQNWLSETPDGNPGQVALKGELAGRYCWDGYCVGSAEFCTNGPQGGDAGHGGYLRVTFSNAASTCMEVAIDGAEPRFADSIAINFRGDAEIDAAIASLEFFASELRSIRKLRVVH